jgi:hypothetical protein
MPRQKIDLWPAKFGDVDARLPLVILREQAALLGEKTGNLVQALVKSGPATSFFKSDTGKRANVGWNSPEASDAELDERGAAHARLEHRFQLVAPALDNYKYELFTIEHRVEAPYPLRLTHDGKVTEVKSEKQLLDHLGRIFNSDNTKRVIATLIQQSQAA